MAEGRRQGFSVSCGRYHEGEGCRPAPNYLGMRSVVMRWVMAGMMLVCWLWAGAAGGEGASQGLEAHKAGKYEQAVEILGGYLKEHPEDLVARRAYGLSLAALERQEEALAVLQAGVQQKPRDTGLLMAQAGVLASMERTPEAIEVYSRVIKLAPKNAEAWKERGVAWAKEGNYTKALEDLNKAAKLSPKDPWVYNHRGMAKFCENRYGAAVEDFSKAIQLRPDLPLSYFFRGNLYLHHLKERDKAIADYREGCKLGHPLCCQELEKLGVEVPGK